MSGIINIMALFIRQDEQKSEFQTKLAAELQAKSKERALKVDRPDGVDDSNYINNTKRTTSLAWIWAIIVVITVGILVWLMALSIAYTK